jgi:hypothetical protein
MEHLHLPAHETYKYAHPWLSMLGVLTFTFLYRYTKFLGKHYFLNKLKNQVKDAHTTTSTVVMYKDFENSDFYLKTFPLTRPFYHLVSS